MKATFKVYWQMGADVTIDLPDNIDPNDEYEVRDYIESKWLDMPLPTDGEYLPGSDEVDFDFGITIKK